MFILSSYCGKKPLSSQTIDYSTSRRSSHSPITKTTQRRKFNSSVELRNEATPRRLLFNVPGSDMRKLNKLTTLDLDIVAFDLEDGVAPNKKVEARENLKTVLRQLTPRSDRSLDLVKSGDFHLLPRTERLIRSNDAKSEFFEEDLENCIFPVIDWLDGILLPKVDEVDDLLKLADRVHSFYQRNNLSEQKPLSIFASIESAKGIINLPSICAVNFPASCTMTSLIYASEDLCADMGITRSDKRTELLYTRQALLTHAKAFHLTSIDLVCLDFKNETKLFEEAKEGADMGFDGKQAIHPNQIPVIYSAFRPSDEKVIFAKKIVDKYSESINVHGKGAFEVDGKMIDLPMVKWAHKILSRAN